MKKIIVVASLLAFALMGSTAQAHHAEGKPTGTYWRCKDNHAKTHGTTKVHVHHKKPSAKHMRRHKCVKKVRKPHTTPAAAAPAPAPVVVEKIVYAPAPPCPTCPSVPCTTCQPPDYEPCGDCEDGHKHQKGKGHQKCKGKGHSKD